MSEFPWCCQKCGDCVGYLGRFFEWCAAKFGFTFHDCPGDHKKIIERYELDKD